MPTIATLCDVMARIAPLALAEPWDNVGLLVGDASDPCSRVLLAIDLVEPVLDEAIELGCDAIVAYHPPIFAPLKRITAAHTKERIVLRAARERIAVHTPHTALDAARGGVNDWLAEGVGAGDVRALLPHAAVPETEATKLVTFCPLDAVDRIRDALATVGAGRIGAYERCSFSVEGEGTFFGGAGTSPTVGAAGRLERVAERRLEVVCPEASLPLALATLRNVHPYEEPPIEVHELRPRPDRAIGAGRRIALDHPCTADALASRLAPWLGVERLAVAGANDRPVEVVGVCAGSGKGLLDAALAQGCQAYVTGELGHHDVLAAVAAGCTVLLAGHTETERGYLPRLRDALHESLGVPATVSERDRAPLAR